MSDVRRTLHRSLGRRGLLVGAASLGVTGSVGRSAFARLLSADARRIDDLRVDEASELAPARRNGALVADGLRLRRVAVTGSSVVGTGFEWHRDPDGGAVFGTGGGGWIYVSNSESSSSGGASSITFDADGTIRGARRILDGTERNCAGGVTPWGTWLSCEERGDDGLVYECDPTGRAAPMVRPLLGRFNHEAAVVDPASGNVFLTEDRPDGRLYRFRPETPGRLDAGVLTAASVDVDPDELREGEVTTVRWADASFDGPDRSSTTSAFRGGEGAWFEDGTLFFTTKRDRRIWSFAPATARLTLLYDCDRHPSDPLDAVDNVTIHSDTGDVYVCEDGGNMEICRLRARPAGGFTVDVVVRLLGHDDSEMTGVAFSPTGDRMYFSSQRGTDGRGVTYELTGSFSATPVGAPLRLVADR